MPDRGLDALPRLLSVGAFCIGTNQIDLATAGTRGAVFNAPFSNTRSVVELVIAEIISLAQRLTEKTRRCTRATGTSPPPGATRCAAGASV